MVDFEAQTANSLPLRLLEQRSPCCAAENKNGIDNKHGCNTRADGRFSIGRACSESEPQQGNYPDIEDVKTGNDGIDELIALGIHEEAWVCGHGISEINGVGI